MLVLFWREAEKADFLPLERFQPVTFGELFHVGRKVRIVTVLPRLHDPAGADHGQPEGHCVPGGDGTQRERGGGIIVCESEFGVLIVILIVNTYWYFSPPVVLQMRCVTLVFMSFRIDPPIE